MGGMPMAQQILKQPSGGSLLSPQMQNRSIQQQQQALLMQQQQQQQAALLAQQQQRSFAPSGPLIREVWKENLESEIILIRELVETFNHVTLAVEFPGIVARPIGEFKSNRDYHYQVVRANADILNVVQLSLTLTDSMGKTPENCPCTFQFNFKFDLESEMCPTEIIDSIAKTGVNLGRTKDHGIEPFEFAQLLTDSGLCLLEDVTWISYHAGYDFAFLISILTNNSLPVDYEEYRWWYKKFFPNSMDLKFMANSLRQNKPALAGKLSLETLAEELGIAHPNISNLKYVQTGIYSYVSSLCYFEFKAVCGDQFITQYNSVLWGLDECDDSVALAKQAHDKLQGGIMSPRPGVLYYNRGMA